MNYIQSFSWKKIVSVGSVLAVVASFFIGVQSVAAASYETVVVSMSGSGELVMKPGEIKEVQLEFLNSGSATWKNDGTGYV
ncbi:hypothetical protein KJ766_04070, partial [Patescibacteria group bacterium]|nr:hypothetical protein [Patescibacteria group bacterium]